MNKGLIRFTLILGFGFLSAIMFGYSLNRVIIPHQQPMVEQVEQPMFEVIQPTDEVECVIITRSTTEMYCYFVTGDL